MEHSCHKPPIWTVFLGFLLLASSVHTSVLATPPDPAEDTVKASPSPAPVKVIRSVLVLADSHGAGYFGRQLHKILRKAYPDAKVTLVGACGKAEGGFLGGNSSHCGVITINRWGRLQHVKGCAKNPCTEADGPKCLKRACRTPKLRTLLRKIKPDLTIVQLGGNSWYMGSMEKGWRRVVKRVHTVADLILKKDSACVWVTPSDHFYWPQDSQDAFAAFYEKTLDGRCTVFNSRPSHRPYLNYRESVEALGLKRRQHDGIHYGWFKARGRTISKQWASDIVSLALEVTHPKKLPTSTTQATPPSAQSDQAVAPNSP